MTPTHINEHCLLYLICIPAYYITATYSSGYHSQAQQRGPFLQPFGGASAPTYLYSPHNTYPQNAFGQQIVQQGNHGMRMRMALGMGMRLPPQECHLQPNSQMHNWQQHLQWISTPPYPGVPGPPVIVPQQQLVASQSPPYNQMTQMQYQQHHHQTMNAQLYLGAEQQLQPVISPQQQQGAPQSSTLTTNRCYHLNLPGDGVSGSSHLLPPPSPSSLSSSALPFPWCDDQPEDQQQQPQGK